jgi:hypothetical protein
MTVKMKRMCLKGYLFWNMFVQKCHAMKRYPVLNQALYHDVWVSGGILSHILNIGTRWSWVVSFTPRLLCPRYPLDSRLSGSYGRRLALDMLDIISRGADLLCPSKSPDLPPPRAYPRDFWRRAFFVTSYRDIYSRTWHVYCMTCDTMLRNLTQRFEVWIQQYDDPVPFCRWNMIYLCNIVVR